MLSIVKVLEDIYKLYLKITHKDSYNAMLRCNAKGKTLCVILSGKR